VNQKLRKIHSILKRQEGVVVAFSGGVDSSLLLKIAKDVLGDRVIAVTASSPIHPLQELKTARQIAKRLCSKHIVYKSNELRKRTFTGNPRRRCYFCKIALFKNLKRIAMHHGYTVVEGSNSSDLNDYRPGLRALKELGIRSPFIKADLSKREIRKLAKRYGLPNWNKPAMACLATRIPYGRRITKKLLKRVELAEQYLGKLKIEQMRVRDYETIARIEVPPPDFGKILRNRKKITAYFRKLGYTYVTLDMEGYQTGSLNR
jgi:uncharacterized protein